MIVEPTPTTAPSPVRRALRLGSLVLPVVLLGAVAGAGVLGQEPATSGIEPGVPSPPAAVADVPRATADAPRASADTPTAAADPATPAPSGPPPPVQFGDLAVQSATTVSERPELPAADVALAVSGHLRVSPAEPERCPAAADEPLGPWCERPGVLADVTWPAGATFSSPVPPHVHVVVPAGVRLPASILRSATRAGSGDAPLGTGRVVVVGRFAPRAGPCTGIRHRCVPPFVVDRFAWADGVRVGVTPLIAERLDTGRRRANPFELALDAADLPLLAVLTWPDGIAALDPAAGAAATAGPASEPVWYLRVLDGARGPELERRVRWVLLTERDLRVIDAGRPRAVIPASPTRPGRG